MALLDVLGRHGGVAVGEVRARDVISWLLGS